MGAAALSLRLGWPIARYRVDGPSMEPGFREGDRLLVNRLAYLAAGPRAGDAVIVRDPEEPSRLLLKRIAAVQDAGAGRYFVVGDNPGASRDSRQFGPVERGAIIGRAWRKY